MSVDQQIREGLVMLDQRLPTPDTYTAYEVIVHEARTRSRRTRYLQGGLVAAAVVAVVATGRLGGTGLDPVPAPQPVDEPSVSADPSVLDGWDDVAGVWRSEPVSIADMAEALEDDGRTSIVQQRLDRLPDVFADPDGIPLVLTFDNGRATMHAVDGFDTVLDTQSYTVEDGVVTVRPLTAPGGRTRFAGEIKDGELTLRFLDTTVDSAPGGPEETLQSALYGTVPFTWIGEAG